MKKFINKLRMIFTLSKNEKELYNYFEKNSTKEDIKPIILVQNVEDISYFSLFGLIIHIVNKDNKFNISQYVSRSLYAGAFSSVRNMLVSIFLANKFRDNKWIKLYSSYCNTLAFRSTERAFSLIGIKLFFNAYNIFKNIKTKEELLKLQIDNTLIGDLIYDSYIRFKPCITVKFDVYLVLVIWQALRINHLANEYFLNNNVKILLSSYSTYIQHGIVVRVALKYDTNVFTFGNNETIYKKLSNEDFFQHTVHSTYKKTFDILQDKEYKINLAKKHLDNRLNGNIDKATAYMKFSSYDILTEDVPNVKNKIVIFMHYFEDSPHGYSMIFNDFYEWVVSTIDFLIENKIPFCIKAHPNKIEENKRALKVLQSRYKNLCIIPENVSNKQLIRGGMVLGVSVRGTIAHELVYLGIPIILCGDNPHSSYSFCKEAKTKEQYFDYLKNYKHHIVTDEMKDEVLSFYYMHNLNHTEEEQQIIELIVKLINITLDDNNINRIIEILNKLSFNKKFNKIIKEGIK